eukprot:2513725-Pleurochrysis_carterae.AAC.1
MHEDARATACAQSPRAHSCTEPHAWTQFCVVSLTSESATQNCVHATQSAQGSRAPAWTQFCVVQSHASQF